jgi:tetratricopeptide (TPR) repeat protein
LYGVVGVPHAITILGRVALALKNYKEAEAWFQECIPAFQDLGHQDNVGQDLACLGYIARKKGQISQARGYWMDALQIAVEGDEFLALFHTLPGIALLFIDKGEAERGVKLYALASTLGIVANSKWFADIAGDEIAVAADGLPVKVAEAAKARGRELDLWETTEELLVELKELGWGSDHQPE